jgi:flagellar motor protein MotB
MSPRWLISFADMILLLLGFFVMLHAQRSDPDAFAAGMAQSFREGAIAEPRAWFEADEIFEPGEAVLTMRGRDRLMSIFRRVTSENRVLVRSRGVHLAGERFDAWELSVARMAAIARMFRQAGLAEDRVEIIIERDRSKVGQIVEVAVLQL